ncbi:sigma-70 family RNA polymerase sigma factor [Pseudobacillus wudalianchiensis]|uniref:RNA polymerase subunit sigma-24 n=1 Tax=Pseudobacillus wudalianchiensis TaxID=1743143 RepID=A0A1B9AYJ7_9BACI|nr:sigma-70 family RNA polymerase sigma factor [Bacillus wudalianchiensis]OCA88904.1 RNA polymerase subunit sigma-24 [Bacillus wudalianchiensis]
MTCFDELVQQFTPMIHHVIKTLHIHKDQEEFVQIGKIALWQAQQRFDASKGQFSNFAYAYMKGEMRKAMTKVNQSEERHVYPSELFWEVKVDEQPERTLELETLLSYAAGLTAKEKNWLVCTFYHQMTVREIADQERVSLSAVKKWRKQAMDKLQSQFH